MSNVEAKPEQGSALLMAVFFMSLLASLGIALLFLSEMNLKLGRTSLNVKKSFYLAESGVETGRRVLFDTNAAAEEFGDRLQEAAGLNHQIDFDPYLLRAVYDDDGNFTNFTGYGDDVPLQDAALLGEGFLAAFLTNDPVDGRTNLTDVNSRVIVTGVGVGPNQSFKIVEAIVEPDISLPPIPPSVLTLLGSSPYFAGGSSSAEHYSGEDCHFLGGGTAGLYVPVVGTTNEGAEDVADDDMATDPDKYESGGYTGEDAGVDLTDPSDPLLAGTGLGTIDPSWMDCSFLQELVAKLRKYASYYCGNPDECTLPGDTTPEDIVFVDGDIVIGPGYIGTGVMVVTGTVNFKGNSSWNGVMLVIGEGVLIRDGGGNGTISGSTIVADIAGPNGIYGDGDDCQPEPGSTDPFGTSHYEVNGGGNTDIDFCSQFHFTDPRSYRVADFRQL